MDTKNLHCKHPKKIKSGMDNDKHEVFVLPPEILKKLGISIGNINVSQVIPSDSNVSHNTEITSNQHNENIPSSNCSQELSDTSILETASLMKKSVFLSPTFIPTIAGEVEILGKKNTEDTFAVIDSVQAQNSVFAPVESTGLTNLPSETNDTQEAYFTEDQAHLSYDNTVNDRDQNHSQVSPDGNEIQVADINHICKGNQNFVESRCDVLDDIHPSRSNINLKYDENLTDCISTCVSLNNNGTNQPVSTLSKINIISEETIPLSELSKLKKLHANINNLTSVTVNSIIDTKMKNENNSCKRTELVKSEVNKSNKKLMYKTNNMQIYAAPTIKPSLGVEATSSKQIAIATERPDNRYLSDLKQNFEDTTNIVTMDIDKKGEEKIYESESSSNQTQDFKETNKVIGDEHYKTSEDSVSENAATVNGFLKHDVDAECIKVNKSSKSYNDQIYTNIEFEVNYTENDGLEKKHSNENSAENPNIILMGTIANSDIPKSSKKQISHSKSNNLQVSNSKTILSSGEGAKHFIGTKQKTDVNISIKNIEDKTSQTLQNDELTNILNATEELSNGNKTVKVDKVKEIAAYLKKFSHIYTDKKKIKKHLSNDNNKKETINSNTNTIESKLCIQGVEKPGGKDVDKEQIGESKVLKTYTRRCLPKKSKLLKRKIHENIRSDSIDTLDCELNTVNISTSCKMQEFCLCNDFGRLAYYDYDALYEHIHFWQNATANCELDLIFAIYSDEPIVNNDSGIEQDQKTEEIVEANICWNGFRNEFPVDNFESDKIWPNNIIDELRVFDGLQLPVAQIENNSSVYKIHDEAHMMTNTSNSNINLETIDHDMEKSAKSQNDDSMKLTQNKENPLNAVMHDKVVCKLFTSPDTKILNTDQSTLDPKLISISASKTESSEIRNKNDEVSREGCDIKEGNSSNIQADTNKMLIKDRELDDNAKNIPKEDVKSVLGNVALKRGLSGKISTSNNKNSNDEPASKKNIKCGLCNDLFSKADWEDHVSNQHHLVAWRAGSSIDLGNPDLLNKLKQRLKTLGELRCSICNMRIKKFSIYMQHIKYCLHQKLSKPVKKTVKPSRKSRTAVDEDVTCGVCQQTMQSSSWLEHIGRNHDYLAWILGEEALDLDKESVVLQHLQNIIRVNGKLTCYKCGFHRSRAKLYLAHVKTCDGSETNLDNSSASVDLDSTSNLSTISSLEDKNNVDQPVQTTTVKCGVCQRDVEILKWIEHIAREHNYLAWQDGDKPVDLDEEEDVWNHLQQYIRQCGGLTCYKCGLIRKRVKLYLTHIEVCDGSDSQADVSSNNISLDSTTTSTDQWYEVPVIVDDKKVVKCGVCSLEVPIVKWMLHIRVEHDYLAWQDGTPPLNLEDESEVRTHLLNVVKLYGCLVCRHCGRKLKYPKSYLQHVKECAVVSADTSSLSKKEEEENKNVTCGVCSKNLESAEWLQHIQQNHEYMAWIDGQPPLDLNDPAMVQKHLYDISKKLDGLLCIKCGVRRKYVKAYLHHVEMCHGKMINGDLSLEMMTKDVVECAMCSEKVESRDWRDHAMKKHYNITWAVGDTPIELNNPYAVESYLKEYQNRYHKLVCKVCGISRVSYVGFYAHIIVCGKSDEETEMYKSTCDICNNKYLRIYKSQHMTMHREKELAKERKLLAAKEKEELKKDDEPEEEIIQGGRRKAAEKAKTVIEKYKSNFHDGSYHCFKCGFSSEFEKELSDHVCVDSNWGEASDSDESVKLDNYSEDESDDTDIDSNVSDEEREAREMASSHKKKRYSDTSQAAKIARLPFEVHNISAYMKKSAEEFAEMYLTEDPLFTQWRTCEFEAVPENELMKYMPPIEESCKVRFDSNQDWRSLKRFESKKIRDTIVMFVGASIQCMSWLPAPAYTAVPQYMAVASHADADVPRYAWDEKLTGHGLVQIWDCGSVTATMPRFVLGLVHDYGTIWAIDWCPSGARDMPELDIESNEMNRLGLLAVACSNGSAYVFCVPYPSSITEKENLFYRLKPVVEMRLTSTTSNENRRSYQATAIKWSTQKGHSHIVVGYSDGTTAFYDLNSESPILRTTENNITVLYPYHDERLQNSCIEDVDMYPSGALGTARAGGVVCVGSAGGAGAASMQSHVAAARVLFPPHWPAALLAGDDCLVNQSINELEWWGGGRRLGGMRSAAGCAWCGRLAAAALPLLRMLRVHPAYPEVHKQVIGTIQMTLLGSKRKRQNDELAMIVEPITYSDAVKKYGIEIKQVTAKDRPTQQKLSAMPRDAYPERFPLSDVAAMQFCPTFKLHHKLALALHAGLVLIISV